MARIRVRFSVRTFEKEIFLDAENCDEAEDYLDNHPEEYESSLVERAGIEIVEGEYDKPEEVESEAVD